MGRQAEGERNGMQEISCPSCANHRTKRLLPASRLITTRPPHLKHFRKPLVKAVTWYKGGRPLPPRTEGVDPRARGVCSAEYKDETRAPFLTRVAASSLLTRNPVPHIGLIQPTPSAQVPHNLLLLLAQQSLNHLPPLHPPQPLYQFLGLLYVIRFHFGTSFRRNGGEHCLVDRCKVIRLYQWVQPNTRLYRRYRLFVKRSQLCQNTSGGSKSESYMLTVRISHRSRSVAACITRSIMSRPETGGITSLLRLLPSRTNSLLPSAF